MAPLTILRTAAGAPAQPSQFRRFRELGVRVVAADCSPNAVGFRFADACAVVPKANDPAYVDTLACLCQQHHVNAILPALDEELNRLMAECDVFDALGVRLLSSPAKALDVCTDKMKTFKWLGQYGIFTPYTWRGDETSLPHIANQYPYMVKPLLGRGGKGVQEARDFYALCDAIRPLGASRCVIQRKVWGQEYTVDVLAGFDGEPLVISPRKRLELAGGVSLIGEVVPRGADPDVDDLCYYVERICRELPLVGPANVQAFIAPDGEIWITEINARLAGSAIFSELAGVPLFAGVVSMCQGVQPEPWTGTAKPITVTRQKGTEPDGSWYWSEAVA